MLAILFGILAGPSRHPWLFRFHRWSRFVALCLAAALGAGMLAEVSPNAAIAVVDLLPLALPLSIVAGLVWMLLPSRRGSVVNENDDRGAKPSATARRSSKRSPGS
jgi:hypothetical protein